MSSSIYRYKRSLNQPYYSINLYILLSITISFLSGCSLFTQKKSTQIKVVYERSAQYHKPDRNPVIVIPGILGSKLIDNETGVKVWGAFDRTSADPSVPAGAKLLSLPISNSTRSG